MPTPNLVLRNAGSNGDSAKDLYTDALEMLRELGRNVRQEPETLTDVKIANEIAAVLAILDGELQVVS